MASWDSYNSTTMTVNNNAFFYTSIIQQSHNSSMHMMKAEKVLKN